MPLLWQFHCGSLINENDRIARLSAEKDKPAKSSSKSLTAFYFDQVITGLSATYTATFAGTNITARIPYGIGITALRPSFTTTGVSVLVSGVPQTSGTTINDFSTPLTYTVIAEDGSSQAYNVTVQRAAFVQDTGQTNCFVMGSTTPCANATYPSQDADFAATPAARSVQASAANETYPADFINRDPVNGIAWKTCAQGLSGSTCATGTAGNQNLATAASACAGLNAANSGAGYAGLQNWRLPSAMELMQIQHFAIALVFYDAAVFPGAPSVLTWTSTQLGGSGNAIRISGNFGNATTGSSFGVRCVAGATYPNHTFTDRGDGTVRENLTGLIWQKCAIGQTSDATCTGSATGMTWSAALQACHNLVFAGLTWRMPNITESMTLFDFTRNTQPYVDVAAFPNFPPTATPTPNMWTSTSLVQNSSYAYVVNYSGVNAATIDAKNAAVTGSNLYYARCVSGP